MKFGFLKIILIFGFILTPFFVTGKDITIESPISATSIPALVDRITNWVFYIGIILAPLMILWGAFTFMTAAGQPNKIETGKKIIFWTIAGLVVILLSRMIIGIVTGILSG